MMALLVIVAFAGGSAGSKSCTLAPGVCFPNNDLKHSVTATAAECCSVCQAFDKCKVWTWNGNAGPMCYLKSGIGRAHSDINCTSGTSDGPLPPMPPPGPPPPGPPSPPVPCEPVKRPAAPKRIPLPLPTQPNIVSLLIDDLGFDDLRSHDLYPGQDLTPAVEGLVSEGILLERHHTYMWCSPTRRSFITGRYPVSVSGVQAGTSTNLTPLQFTLLSEKMAAGGYASHFIGKGHLGWQTTDHLLVNRGFESHVGYLGGSQNYNWGGGSENPYEGKHDMWHNELPGTDVVPEIYYSTEFYTGYAIDKIEKRNTTRPLWIHVAYQAMHGGGSRGFPPAQDVINQTKVGFRSQEYGNALRSLDSGIRNITDVLKSEGLWDNTLVMIWADNGGDNPGGSASNFPLLGRKCLAWEGGTRVFAAATGGLIPPNLRGTSNQQLMHIADWYATFSTLAGVDPTDAWVDSNGTTHDIDGINLWPVLTAGASVSRTWLPTTPQSILHTDGPHMWKLITLETQSVRFYKNGTNYADPFNACLSPTTVFDCVDSEGNNGGGGRQSCHVCTPDSPCLYDVLADPGETINVAKANPTLVFQMNEQLSRYQLPYVFDATLTPANLACYNCSFNSNVQWHNYTGPGCINEAGL
eukprot:m.88875 g.88875  ORF g.88875 m.88875 type:complete len:637 (-) comp20024_c0_seq1:254-2164(-)